MDQMRKKATFGFVFLAAMIGVLSNGAYHLLFAETPDKAFDKIIGNWMRPDGGYVIEIRSVDANGKCDAAYYNPVSIHVAQAEATWDGDAIKVFIELRDVNYPGSNYHLVYDSENDQLKGDYYQAIEQEHYEIFFERMKK